MRRFSQTIFASVLLFAWGSNSPHAAESSPDTQKAANLTTMTEATLATVTLVQDRSGGKFGEMSWSATFSERDWVLTAAGKINDEPFGFTISGYRWGGDKEDWLVNFAGLGGVQKERLSINGKSIWRYDEKLSDHVAMDFQQVAKFGEHSIWGWVVGSEILIGGTIGAGSAIATAGLATGGVALGASIWIGAGGYAFGSAAMIGVSAGVKELLKSDSPPPAPVPPERPKAPNNGVKLVPEKGTIYTAIARDGTILASSLDGVFIVSGKYDSSGASGTIRQRNQ
jgi:hypothetical protein